MASTVTPSDFLNYLGTSWDTSLPLKNLWTLEFTNLKNVAANVDSILNSYERTSSSIKRFPVYTNLAGEYGAGKPFTYFLASKVGFPTDSFVVNSTPNENMGGLFGGYYASQRENYTSIDISFLETNIDIFDFLIRPWVLAASYMGLVDDGTLSIKTDMIANLYTRNDKESWKLRKKVYFEKVVPVTAPGETLTYSTEFDLFRQASFIYSKYHILDNTGNVGPTLTVQSVTETPISPANTQQIGTSNPATQSSLQDQSSRTSRPPAGVINEPPIRVNTITEQVPNLRVASELNRNAPGTANTYPTNSYASVSIANNIIQSASNAARIPTTPPLVRIPLAPNQDQ